MPANCKGGAKIPCEVSGFKVDRLHKNDGKIHDKIHACHLLSSEWASLKNGFTRSFSVMSKICWETGSNQAGAHSGTKFKHLTLQPDMWPAGTAFFTKFLGHPSRGLLGYFPFPVVRISDFYIVTRGSQAKPSFANITNYPNGAPCFGMMGAIKWKVKPYKIKGPRKKRNIPDCNF